MMVRHEVWKAIFWRRRCLPEVCVSACEEALGGFSLRKTVETLLVPTGVRSDGMSVRHCRDTRIMNAERPQDSGQLLGSSTHPLHKLEREAR